MRDFLCAEDLLIDPDECGEDSVVRHQKVAKEGLDFY